MHTATGIKEWRKKLKLYAIEVLGGKCTRCAYNKCTKALEFHHVDETTKERNLSGAQVGFEKYLEELRKCTLLCANCHREVHDLRIECVSSYDDERASKYLNEYNILFIKKVNWANVDLLKLKEIYKTNVAMAEHLGVSESMVRKKLKSLSSEEAAPFLQIGGRDFEILRDYQIDED